MLEEVKMWDRFRRDLADLSEALRIFREIMHEGLFSESKLRALLLLLPKIDIYPFNFCIPFQDGKPRLPFDVPLLKNEKNAVRMMLESVNHCVYLLAEIIPQLNYRDISKKEIEKFSTDFLKRYAFIEKHLKFYGR